MPLPGDWDEEDEWYTDTKFGARHVYPPRRRLDSDPRRSDRFLSPEGRFHAGGLHRSRSQGHAPTPNVTIYNTVDADANPRIHSEQPSATPSPRPSPRGRPLRLDDEWALEDEIAEFRVELARDRRVRSRSRGPLESQHHHEHWQDPSSSQSAWQLQVANDRLKEAEARLQREKEGELIRKRAELRYYKDKKERDEEEARIKAEEDRIRREYELKSEKEGRKRDQRAKEIEEERRRILSDAERKAKEAEDERQRIVAENTLKLEKAERGAKEARQRAIDEYERKKAKEEMEAKEARQRAIDEYERKKLEDAKKQKEAEEALIAKLKKEEEEKKAREKKEWEEFLRKQKDKEEEEKAKKKKQEEELEAQMRQRLGQFGFQENQIQAMIKPEKAKELQQGLTPANPVHFPQPTYVKVHRDHLSIDTLVYYDIPWEYDSIDKNYIIILREMDSKETDILFEHTRRLRTRSTTGLMIEERDHHSKPDYAWVRRRRQASPSPSRRSTPKRIVGIKEMFY